MSSTRSNGSSQSGSHVPEIVASLRLELDGAERELERYAAELEERRATVTRLRKAIELLEPNPRRRPGGPRRKDASLERARPRPETIDAVLAALIAAGEPQSTTQIAKRLDGELSHDPVRRALYALRNDERIRVTGTTERGATLYAPMPEVLEEARTEATD